MTWPRVRCPLCSRRTALVVGKLAYHPADGQRCRATGLTTYQATVILAKDMEALEKAKIDHHG